jgi:hypothetical protein
MPAKRIGVFYYSILLLKKMLERKFKNIVVLVIFLYQNGINSWFFLNGLKK